MSHLMMASQMSSTLPAQVGELAPGGRLTSNSCTYHVQSFLGQGTFGKVVKCTRLSDMKTVAIKMIKIQGSSVDQSEEEVAVLRKLRSLDSDKCNLVRWYQVFADKGHVCLEFEHLDKSLGDFMKERYLQPPTLKEIRPIVQQLANALDHLRTAGIIHADLKLENVMLVNHLQEPYRVKVIDFGLACDVSAARLGSYVQTRPYRAPEIILGLPFTEAIDMWSLGCMAATMYLGAILYPGMSQYDMMRYIVETQGQPPDKLLDSGCYTGMFFERDHDSTTSMWKLKTPGQIQRETGVQSMETRRVKLTSLDGFLHIRAINPENPADKVAEMIDVLMFVDMLKGMLQLDASKRITPRQVLEHQFTRMDHLVCMYHLSDHVKSCFDMMDFCQNEASTSDTGKAVCGSQQQTPSRKASSIRQNPPPPHAEETLPCTSKHSRASNRSGKKRKADDDDENINNASRLSKRVKRVLVDQHSHGAPTSSCSRQEYANYIQASTGSRSHPAMTLQPSSKAHPSKYSQTQSLVRSGIKRKMADCEDLDSHHYRRSDQERKRVRNCYAGRSTCRCSAESTHTPRGQSGLRSSPTRHHRHSARPSSSSRYSTHAPHGQSGLRSSPTRHHRHSARPSSSSRYSTHAHRGQSGLRSSPTRHHRHSARPSSGSRYYSHAPRGQPDLRSSPAEQHQDHACTSSSSQTRNKAGSKIKRQEADDEDAQPRKKSRGDMYGGQI